MQSIKFTLGKVELNLEMSLIATIVVSIIVLLVVSTICFVTVAPLVENIVTTNTEEYEENKRQVNEKIDTIEEDIREIRNIMDYLFGPQDISSTNDNLVGISGLTARDVDYLLRGTVAEGSGIYVIAAERLYGVNAWLMLSLGSHESAAFTSNFAVNRNNFFGWKAYDNNPNNAMYFSSAKDSFYTVARAIKNNYLSPDGNFYHSPTLRGMNIRYASDPNWAIGVLRNKISLESRLMAGESL